MADRTQRTTATSMRTVVDPKMSLSLWLRAGRAAKGLSLDDVAKITKIQARILERLEAGKLDGLPAEVFVRGFVRSYARCCGLDEADALERYAQAASPGTGPTATNTAGVSRASALVESMSELAPVSASRGPRVLTDVQLAAGSLTGVPKQETVVEAFLPVNGTLVEDVVPTAVAVSTELSAPVAIEEPVAIEVPVIEATPVVSSETSAAPVVVEETAKKKRGRGDKGRKGRKREKQMAEGTPSSPMPTVAPIVAPIVAPAESAAVEAPIVAEGSTTTATMSVSIDGTTDVSGDVTMTDAANAAETTTEPVEPWSPKMPTVMPSVPWRRPTSTLMSTAPKAIVPSIVIDDADPESAEREIEDRAASKEPARRSFLPPILLDREDRSARQGGLTLAVIILLIAATLTLSYLMRRPSSTGDGVTMLDETSQTIVAVV